MRRRPKRLLRNKNGGHVMYPCMTFCLKEYFPLNTKRCCGMIMIKKAIVSGGTSHRGGYPGRRRAAIGLWKGLNDEPSCTVYWQQPYLYRKSAMAVCRCMRAGRGGSPRRDAHPSRLRLGLASFLLLCAAEHPLRRLLCCGSAAEITPL